MPTGYTANVQDGKDTFEQFVWRCARAFGALITMRDDPQDAEVPEKFEVDAYHYQQVRSAEEEVARFRDMTDEEAELGAEQEYREAVEFNRQQLKRRRDKKANYEAMLKRVTDWEPPSPDHEKLREFMIEQLKLSLRFDCEGEPYLREARRMPAKEWLRIHRESAAKLLHSRRLHLREEEERVRERNEWIRKLRESVPYERPGR